MSDIDAVTTETPFPATPPTPDPADIQKLVEAAVAKAEAERRGPAVKTIRCTSCYEWTNQYNSQGVCVADSSRGLAPAPDHFLCRRLGMPKGIFFPGIANTLSILSKSYWGADKQVTVSELLDEEIVPFEQLADLFDEAQRKNGKLPYRRAETTNERAAREAEAADRAKRDARRSLLSQKNGLVKQIEDYTTRLSNINAKLEALGEDVS